LNDLNHKTRSLGYRLSCGIVCV